MTMESKPAQTYNNSILIQVKEINSSIIQTSKFLISLIKFKFNLRF